MKKKFLILFLVLFIITTFIISKTYAKYVTNTDGEINMNIARWKILVNNDDITSNATILQTIYPTYIESDYIKENVIAPSKEGYFILSIDSSETDVAYSYDITFNTDILDNIKDIVITSYQIDDNEIINIDKDNMQISNNVLLNDKKKFDIKIFIKWIDNTENETMDNNQDTNASQSISKAKLDLKINFKQLNK